MENIERKNKRNGAVVQGLTIITTDQELITEKVKKFLGMQLELENTMKSTEK